MELVDNITITDKHGFIKKIVVKHNPTIGISIAYHDDNRIASREYGIMHPPMSDDDREWEQWEERFRERCDGIISDLNLECKMYFNQLT